MSKLKEQAKAIVAGLIAGGTALGTALADGSVTPAEWTAVGVAALVAYQAVYWTGQPMSLSKVPRLSADGVRAFLATTKTGDLVDIAAARLTVDQAVKLAEKVGEREDRERAR